MPESASSLLSAWSSFYVMTGSAAASLTGLMFVVITLVRRRMAGSRDGIDTFSTPTVMHFGAALLISAVLSAPWRALALASISVGAIGLWGVGYVIRIMYRTMRLSLYRADREDWIWYNILPLVVYLTVLAGAIALLAAPKVALFVVGFGIVLLLFIGIRNAWDVVTYIAVAGADEPNAPDRNDGDSAVE